MTLDPQVLAWRAARAAAGTAPLYTQTLAEARAADLAAIRAGGGPRLAAQLLVYPNTDQRPGRGPTGEEDPLPFNRHSVEWYRRHYLADPGDAAHPLASPLLAEDLAGGPDHG